LAYLAAGANGYLVKRQLVLGALEAAVGGDLFLCSQASRAVAQFIKGHGLAASVGGGLSPRQDQVLALEAHGLTYKQIAGQLGPSIHKFADELMASGLSAE
jgi:DNA-binding NarL/FixJ family response regulator